MRNYNAQIEQYRRETASKLDTVTTDGTLNGAGTKTDPLNVRLNHSAVMSDTGKTVYPTLMPKLNRKRSPRCSRTSYNRCSPCRGRH